MTLVGTLNVISKFYSGGIGQYANRAGKSNIEFEAKVITDLIQLKKMRFFLTFFTLQLQGDTTLKKAILSHLNH